MARPTSAAAALLGREHASGCQPSAHAATPLRRCPHCHTTSSSVTHWSPHGCQVAGSKIVMRRRKGGKAEKDGDSPAMATEGVISTRVPVAWLPESHSPGASRAAFAGLAAEEVQPTRSDTWGTATPARRPSGPTVGDGLDLGPGGELKQGRLSPGGGLGARLRSLQSTSVAMQSPQPPSHSPLPQEQQPQATYPNRLSA